MSASSISPHWAKDVEDFTTWLRAAGQSEGTIRLRRWGLAKLAEHTAPTGPREITPEMLHSWVANPGWSPNTRKSARATIRRFFQWENATKRRDDDPAALLLGVRIPPATPRPTPTSIVRDALERAENPRLRLMILLAAYGGLRRSEIAQVHADDVEGDFLLVTGKGGRRRFIGSS